MAKAPRSHSPETLVRYIDFTLEKFREFDVDSEVGAFYQLIRFKALELLSHDIQQDKRMMGIARTQVQYAEALESEYIKGEYGLEQRVLLKLHCLYDLPLYMGRPVFEMSVEDFKRQLTKVFIGVFQALLTFRGTEPLIAELLEQFDRDQEDMRELLKDDAAREAQEALDASKKLTKDYQQRHRGFKTVGMTTAELDAAMAQSRKDHGGTTGYKDSEWNVGYRGDSWTPDDDSKPEDGDLQAS